MAKKDKTTFKDTHGVTRVGSWLRTAAEVGKEFAPELLDVVGSLTGVNALETLADKIRGNDQMTQEDKEIALKMIEKDIEDAKQETERQKIDAELQAKIEAEVSARWTADMNSESWLARNTRPLLVLFSVFVYLTTYVIDSIETIQFSVPESHQTIIVTLLFTTVGGYFGLRSLDKYQSKKAKQS